MKKKPESLPPQHQEDQPGDEYRMYPEPEVIRNSYKGCDKLKDKVALITGGDSGIGRAVAVHYAREGANIAIIHLQEDEDAEMTRKLVEKEGQECLIIKGDITSEGFCRSAVREVIEKYGKLNILVNNAAQQYPSEDFQSVDSVQFEKTFRINIFSYYYFSHEALKQMKEGDVIINTTSVTAYRGSHHLVDYSATKGAIVSFSRSLAKNLAEKGIRVNAVAPGPIWTPLIPSSFDEEKVASFGKDVPMGRAGQPSEVAPAYVFLANEDSSYITGQIFHINGGEIVGG